MNTEKLHQFYSVCKRELSTDFTICTNKNISVKEMGINRQTNKQTSIYHANSALQNNKTRDIWPDVLRCIACFAVIVLHVSCAGFYCNFTPDMYRFQICNFYDALVRFCVPVFVMISGKYLLDPKTEYPATKIFRKIFRIGIALLVWSFFYTGIDQLQWNHTIHLRSFIRNSIFYSHYHLWFLFMISGLYAATPILRWIVQNEKVLRYFLILSFLYCFCANLLYRIPVIGIRCQLLLPRLNIQLVTGYSTYFLLGYWMSSHPISRKQRLWIYATGIGSVLFTIIANGMWCIYRNTKKDYLFDNLYPNTLFTSVALFVFIRYALEKKTLAPFLQKIINRTAQYSFGIYLVHLFVFEHLHWIGMRVFFIHPLFYVPLASITTFILSFAIIAILSKISWFRKYAM